VEASRRRRLILLVAASLAAVAVLAPARAGASDASATHAYIQADLALARAGVAGIGRAQARIHAYNKELAAQCPGVGRGAPQTEEGQTMSAEVVAALWSLAYGANARPINAFLAKVSRLRWSNNAITRAAKSFARSWHELATLPLPPLCADIAAWKANGFQTIPPSALSAVDVAESIHPRPVSARMLAPFASAADRRTYARASRLEQRIGESEFELGQDDWLEVLGTLKLPQ
jgi:hypothetical protein